MPHALYPPHPVPPLPLPLPLPTAAGDDATAAGAAEQTEDAERPLPVLPLVPRRMDAGAPCKPRAWARARAGQLAGVGSYPLVRYRVQYRCVAYSVMPM